MEVTVDKLKEPSYVFRVLTDHDKKDKLNASCVIETINPELCKIHILNIVDGITMGELRPKIQAKVMALGFLDYEYSRTYGKETIQRKVNTKRPA